MSVTLINAGVEVISPKANTLFYKTPSGFVATSVKGTGQNTYFEKPDGSLSNSTTISNICVRFGSGPTVQAKISGGSSDLTGEENFNWSANNVITSTSDLGDQIPIEVKWTVTKTKTIVSGGEETTSTTSYDDSHTYYVQVKIDTASPVLEIISPNQNPTINIPETGSSIELLLNAQDAELGIQKVVWAFEGQEGEVLAEIGPNWNYKAVVPVSSLPINQDRTVTVTAKDFAGNPTSKTFTFKAKDNTPPVFDISSPNQGKKIPWSGGLQTVIEASGTATDMQSGIASVTCTLLDKSGNKLISDSDTFPSSSPGRMSWNVKLPVEEAGWYTVLCEFRDHAGNVSSQTISNLEVAESFSPTDINDLLGSRQYLADLLKFFKDHFKRGQEDEPANLTEKDLQQAFLQEFGRLARQTDAATAQKPVNQVRLCIEVLRKFLNGQMQSVGHWKLDEGLSTDAVDISGSGNNGKLMNGALWATERGRQALSLDGLDDYVQVEAPSQLGMTSMASISAWIYPKGSDADPAKVGVIVSKQGEYGVSRFADGTLRWRFANSNPGYQWFNTGVTVPLNQWAHIIVTYDSGLVTTYVNGKSVHTHKGAGPISVNNQSSNDFRIGWSESPNEYFQGLLSDIRIYNRALTVTEVYSLHNASRLERKYAQFAYETLLRKLGTSYEELRLSHGAAQEKRRALAERLGIHLNSQWSDYLEDLLLEPGEITEAKLESLFGLMDTTQDPFRDRPSPLLLEWQLTQLRAQWTKEDQLLKQPIIDPDVIGKADLARTELTDPAFAIWKQRHERITSRYSQFKADREQETSAATGFQKIITDALSGLINNLKTSNSPTPCAGELTVMDFLTCLDNQQKDGKNIQPILDALYLDLSALHYLLRISALAQTDGGAVTEEEWEAVYHILTRVWKGAQRTAWRAEEAQLVISPQYFKIYQDELPTLPCTGAMDGALLSAGTSDPNWLLLKAPDGVPTDKVYVTKQQPASWVANSAASHWICPSANASEGNPPGQYVYQTTFDLSGWDLSTVQIIARISVDDDLLDIRLNGVSLNLSILSTGGSNAWSMYKTIPLSGPLADGDNTVEFVVNNGGSSNNPTGLRVEMSFAALPSRVRLPKWRVSERARSEWQSALRTRLDQADGLRSAFDTAIQATEEAALPLLRDSLIFVIGACRGLSPGEAADWLSERLLLETKGGGWRLTTRALQAIETIQSLVFSLRTQRLGEEHPARMWFLPPAGNQFDTQDQFEEEWLWIGNYETWRAAMLVFYYPENILLPSLREPADRTPQFNKLLQTLRAKSRITPAGARALAKEYLNSIVNQETAGEIVSPKLLPPFMLTDERTESGLRELRKTAHDLLVPFNPNSPSYLREIFYFVPMTLASQLQKSGEYTAALDWLQTVYAYDLPRDIRKIYPGISIEKNGAPRLSRTEHWLREFINPHTLAEGRAYPADATTSSSNPYTRFTLISLARCFLEYADSEFTRDTGESLAKARSLYLSARSILAEPDFDQIQPSDGEETLLPNPILDALRNRIENQLAKLRLGRNIAGMKREIEIPLPPKTIVGLPTVGSGGQLVIPGMRPHLKPTPYRFSVLMERSKQLVGIAQQIEAVYLAALEKRDNENYNLKKAGFDLQLAEAGNRLQELRETEAIDGEMLATKQKSRATKQKETYSNWIEDGLSLSEQLLIANYTLAGAAQINSAELSAGITISQAITSAATANAVTAAAAWTGAAATSILASSKAISDRLAIGAQTAAQILSLEASHERRVNDWQLAKDLAEIDEQIADQQGIIATDHKNIVLQEKAIAQIQSMEARAMADYLANKFTSAELYEWMSGILGGVYNYFLQQATSVAILAENQLTFERQEAPTSFIQNDYWETPSDGTASGSSDKKPDRRGLTGSARLLQDIYQLDQYAFESNKRKLNLTHTISLASLDPYAFQVFRSTGVLNFNTPMRIFDEAFPGHYLRLIKRVRTSVVALIPPVLGIRATLMASGISRVVVGGDVFQETVIRRDPEVVALSSPVNATGVFELDAQSELLLPFESMGVDTRWEFSMPKASNPFDYSTIADVLITIEYTALYNDDYRRQVIKNLDLAASADRAYSIRNDFPDLWYDLNNPTDSVTPVEIRFRSERSHFPPNLEEDIRVKELLFVVLPEKDGALDINGEVSLSYMSDFPDNEVSGKASLTDLRIHTRLQNGNSAWGKIRGKHAIGSWKFTLPADLSTQIKNGLVSDVLVVMTFAGTKPAWPF